MATITIHAHAICFDLWDLWSLGVVPPIQNHFHCQRISPSATNTITIANVVVDSSTQFRMARHFFMQMTQNGYHTTSKKRWLHAITRQNSISIRFGGILFVLTWILDPGFLDPGSWILQLDEKNRISTLQIGN